MVGSSSPLTAPGAWAHRPMRTHRFRFQGDEQLSCEAFRKKKDDPKMGGSWVIGVTIHFRLGFSLINHHKPSFLGYPHDYGNLQISQDRRVEEIGGGGCKIDKDIPMIFDAVGNDSEILQPAGLMLFHMFLSLFNFCPGRRVPRPFLEWAWVETMH